MEPDRFEMLLRGYELPAVSTDLDRRVLTEAADVLEPSRGGRSLADLGHSLLDALGFGYALWLLDLVTHTDAEYGVEIL